MNTFLTIIHILVCLFLILVVLLQAGKGGGMGIAFGGGGGSQTVFGSSGAGNFLTRLTSITAVLFMLTSLVLAHNSSRQDSKRLQRLETKRAADHKAEEERLAKLKDNVQKTDAAKAGQSAAPTPAAGTTGAAPTEMPVLPPPGAPLKLTLPKSLATPPQGEPSEPAKPARPAKGAKREKAEKTEAPAKASPAPGAGPGPGASPGKEGATPVPGDKPAPKRRKKAPPAEGGDTGATAPAAPAPASPPPAQ
jgi:preprotein translocase subunit SecG